MGLSGRDAYRPQRPLVRRSNGVIRQLAVENEMRRFALSKALVAVLPVPAMAQVRDAVRTEIVKAEDAWQGDKTL